MFYFGRLISAFFNQFFRWLFWNKTGQKVLFTIFIFVIAVCFIKLGEVSAVEEVIDINYEVKSYYDGVVNQAILRLSKNFDNIDSNLKQQILESTSDFYFYYGNQDGSSLENAKPYNNGYIYIARFTRDGELGNVLSTDYIGETSYTMYKKSLYVWRISSNGTLSYLGSLNVSYPLFVRTYCSSNWLYFVDSIRNNDMETLTALLEDINDSLSNTTPDQESEDSVIVDSSATDSVDTSQVDNVFSSAFTSFANKFTYYDLSDADQWVITINGTRIVLRSNILYNMISNTWFYPMLQLLWYYIFGHYAFVWLTNLIHKIKDGSILDGLEVNEVISKEML